jgi:hypothetical protein
MTKKMKDCDIIAEIKQAFRCVRVRVRVRVRVHVRVRVSVRVSV